jgi:hypothetical protein
LFKKILVYVDIYINSKNKKKNFNQLKGMRCVLFYDFMELGTLLPISACKNLIPVFKGRYVMTKNLRFTQQILSSS